MKINILSFLSLLFIYSYGFAQKTISSPDDDLFISGLSPNILQKGVLEVNFNSVLFSNWNAFYESVRAARIIDRRRITEFSSNIDVYYGTTKNGRWDLGLRVNYARRLDANNAQSGVFDVFGNQGTIANTTGIDKTYKGIREIGVRFRVVPFKSIKNLTLNTGYSFAPSLSEETQQFLGADRNRVDINTTYFVNLNTRTNSSYYYFALSGSAAIPKNNSLADRNEFNDEVSYQASGSFFLIQRINRLTIFPGITYGIGFKPPYVEGKTLVRTNSQVLGTLGFQFEFTDNFSLNLSSLIPFSLENSYKLVQPVKESYSFISLGGRLLLNR